LIIWSDPTFESQPAPVLALLTRALAAAPRDPRLLSKLGNVHLDRYDFAAAAQAFRAALAIDPTDLAVRLRLARCCNVLGREAECLSLLDPDGLSADEGDNPDIRYHRAVALDAVGKAGEAELEVRAALARDAYHSHACTLLMRLLRKSGRAKDLLAECEGLAAKGVRHAQLLLEWGRACALNADPRRAAQLLLDHARVFETALPAPQPFADIATFNAAFAEELLSHPVILADFPKDEANRGSRRIHHLTGGGRPELVRALAAEVQGAVDRLTEGLRQSDQAERSDPWIEAMPKRARLHAWGLVQRSGEFEDWHFHRGGWLSGVYYVRIPDAFSEAEEGQGCLEFGPPPALVKTGLAPCRPLRIAPRQGLLVLSPSHYHHRTIPFTAAGYRMSFAFDVVPLNT
jgi:tetratricopeptide (TPR) repeat protein